MKLRYRKAYLTDGTQVKITEELHQQFRRWEQEGYQIPFEYSDMLKQEDNEMINANRKFYRHNISLDSQLPIELINSALLHDKSRSIDDYMQNKERRKQIIKVLNLCTATQRRRFIKHYYLGLSYSELAKQENCSKRAIEFSIKAAEKMIINCEHVE